MGTVYEAQDVDLARHVALKIFDADSALSTQEAHVLAQLEHPGIVPVHDCGTLPDGRAFYAMKLVRGTRLDDYRAIATSLSQVLRIFQNSCDAVAFAHARGIIHRDLKPENIMVGSFGEALIMDWGVARIASGFSNESHGLVVGTESYMAPEQARGEIQAIDVRSDIYSLGAILRFLAGSTPPRALRAIFLKAMSPQPAHRYATAVELSEDVARFLDGMTVGAYKEGLFERASRFASHNKMAVVLVLTYLTLRILFIFFFRH
jgi:serine/threonine protein kinase